MEKFSRWRDPGTGIQPFVIPKPPPRRVHGFTEHGLAWTKTLIGPLLAIVRLAGILILSALLAALQVLILALFFWQPLLQRVLTRLTCAPVMRCILFLIGFYQIHTEWASLRKGRRPVPNDGLPTWPHGRQITHGSIVVANHSSYVDLLYLYFRFSPVFTEVIGDDRFRVVSLWEALYRCGEYDRVGLEAPDAKTLAEICQWAKESRRGPVVLFPEVTTSNGKGVLKMLPVLSKASEAVKEHKMEVVAIRYVYDQFSPTYTAVGGKLMHLFHLCAQWGNEMEVRYMLPQEWSAALPEEEKATLEDRVLFCLCQMLRTRKTALGFRDKRDFLDFYRQFK